MPNENEKDLLIMNKLLELSAAKTPTTLILALTTTKTQRTVSGYVHNKDMPDGANGGIRAKLFALSLHKEHKTRDEFNELFMVRDVVSISYSTTLTR